jgi:hypothetical protein
MKDFFEITEAFIPSVVNKEDKFYKVLDSYSEEFLDDFIDVISYDNVETDKKITKGQWIKIGVEGGYEVHYAKPITIKDNFFLEKRINSNNKKITKLIKKGFIKESQRLESENIFFETCIFLGLKPYFVVIKKSGRNEYVLPYQYELSNGIEINQ